MGPHDTDMIHFADLSPLDSDRKSANEANKNKPFYLTV